MCENHLSVEIPRNNRFRYIFNNENDGSQNKTSQDTFTQFCNERYIHFMDDMHHLHKVHAQELRQVKTELIENYDLQL